MAYKTELRIATVAERLKAHCRALIQTIDDAYSEYLKITDARNGQGVNIWSRVLYGTGDTGQVTLTVNATEKSVACLTGANLFSNYRVGRDINLSGFTNSENNQNNIEIITVTDDKLTLDQSSTGWISETDTTARVRENATSLEEDVVQAVIDTVARFDELKDALDNGSVATADRRADLMDFIW